MTTIMITHNMKDALRFGNRIVVMNEGQEERRSRVFLGNVSYLAFSNTCGSRDYNLYQKEKVT